MQNDATLTDVDVSLYIAGMGTGVEWSTVNIIRERDVFNYE